ncbi:MAG: hypothetical protein PHV75_09295, partial [Victivallaceae bacterium]|nr:hypothetical protein [Victivallaceae bacterium]
VSSGYRYLCRIVKFISSLGGQGIGISWESGYLKIPVSVGIVDGLSVINEGTSEGVQLYSGVLYWYSRSIGYRSLDCSE